MKKIFLLAAAGFLLVFPLAGEAASASQLAIVLPLDKSFVESEPVTLVLKVGQNSVDEVQVVVNGKRVPVAAKSSDRYNACYDGIHLTLGLNRIKVSGYKDGRKIEEAAAQVFFRSDLSPGDGTPPKGFRRYLFHTDANEKECTPCHELNFSKADGKQENPDRSPCYLCHKKILSDYKYVHGPAAVWSCLMCHDGKGSTPKLAVVKPVDATCANCHEKSWDGKKYLHGPTAAGNCTTCHNPHAADKAYFLRMDAGDLCASCHEEVLTRPHVLTGFSGSSHPLRISQDPFNPGKDFSCVSCHNPHGSDSPVFLNAYEDSMSMQHFCQSCHKM